MHVHHSGQALGKLEIGGNRDGETEQPICMFDELSNSGAVESYTAPEGRRNS